MASENSPDSDRRDGRNDAAVDQSAEAADDSNGLGHLNLMELDTIDIPDQTQFKIGEVAKLLDLEPYVLRYWEKEFDLLSPAKTESGQRTYHRDDIELAVTIRHLLYTEMFKIDGARRQLELARDGEPSYLTTTLNADETPDTTQEANQLRAEKKALEEELDSSRDTIEQLRQERRDLRARVEDLREQLERDDDQSEAVEEWRQTARESKQRVSELEAELADARDTIDELREELAEATSADAGLDPETVETQRELLADMKREVSALSNLAAN